MTTDLPDVSYEHLLHPIALHLPLQLLWRLVPLSRSFRRVLSAELFWKIRCQNEFRLLHDTITNYREYFVKRTENCYGQLYSKGEPVTHLKRAKQMITMKRYPCESYVLTTEQTLFILYTHEPMTSTYCRCRPLCTNVERLIPLHEHLCVVSEKDSFMVGGAEHYPFGPGPPHIRDIIENVLDHIIVFLTEEGRLYYTKENEKEHHPIEHNELVLEIADYQVDSMGGQFELEVLLTDGFLVNWYIDFYSVPPKVTVSTFGRLTRENEMFETTPLIRCKDHNRVPIGTNVRRVTANRIIRTDGTGIMRTLNSWEQFQLTATGNYDRVVDSFANDHNDLVVGTKIQ